MKKSILILLSSTFFTFTFFAQQANTLPENGNVGLGTLTPSAKLDVNGNVHIDSMLMVKDSILIQKDARVKNNLKVEGDISLPNLTQSDSLNNNRDLLIYDQELNKMTSLKLAKLDEYIYGQDCAQKTDQNGNVLNPTWSNDINKIYADCPQIFVGIATIEPKYNLDVHGVVRSQQIATGYFGGDAVEGYYNMKTNLPINYDDNIFIVQNPHRKIFQINNNGLVQAREIKVDLNNWPDYVFEPTYKLNTLSEIETFIKKNKHLPNVPDAKTMEAEGLNLAEMDKILMQKVEELTLYLIQQNKTLEEQAKKIKELEILLQK